jgi:hypothetical protein
VPPSTAGVVSSILDGIGLPLPSTSTRSTPSVPASWSE